MKKYNTYVLGMFPYPSGEGLHVGHVRIFAACDVMARYFRMKGQQESQSSDHSPRIAQGSELRGQVLSPMGWDAFGLPAENAAIKAKKIPQEMVPHNYANFKKQMQNLSLDFDWEREFATTDPSYYAITQWIFLQLYGKKDQNGKRLVYREKVAINWCPKCLTGLANEEVLPDGTHERCGTVVGKKLLPQWVMRITLYAERLLNDLDIDLSEWFDKGSKSSEHSPKIAQGSELGNKRSLDWPKGILEMQRNWIGKKEGITTTHFIDGFEEKLETFSAYPAWLFADTFISIAPEHPLVAKLVLGTEQEAVVAKFLKESSEISAQDRLEDKFEKKGVFTGRYALDPLNNNRKMPIWIANFVMMGFGTGIVRSSGHDVRDWEFAQKYGIKVNEVVERTDPKIPVNAHENIGVLKDSGPFTGRSISKELINEMVEWMVQQGHTRREVTWHLRDWVFSRQRYWGEPIPLVYCDKCGDENGVVPVPEDQLPLELPTLESYEPTETGESPLSRVDDWVNTTCPKCGGAARRETDTMPNWAGSCWYFLAFAFWKSGFKVPNSGPESSEPLKPYTDWWFSEALPKIKEFLPVDWYLGGAEHAVLHLLYARFWVKVLQDLKLLDFPEPFLRLRSVGLVLAEDGKKMSKSIGNVVNPDDMVAKYGSDAVRMYEMFMGPWEQSIAWDSGAISGQVRFLGRIKDIVKRNAERIQSSEHLPRGKAGSLSQGSELGVKTTPVLASKLKDLVNRVEEGVLNQKFNTSIAGLMEFINTWREEGMVLSKEHLDMFASLLSLFAPEMAGEIITGSQSSDHLPRGKAGPPKIAQGSELGLQWPDVASIEGVDVGMATIAVQVNGKLRATVEIASAKAKIQSEVMEIVMSDEKVKKWLTGDPKKIIFVPGKLMNLVV